MEQMDFGGETVALLGGTGRTGVHIVKRLRERNAKIRALVRDVERAKSILKDDEIEYVLVDILDIKSIEKGISGAKFVVSALGGFSPFGFGFLTGSKSTPYNVDYLGITNLTDACKSSPSNPQFVLISSALMERTLHPVHVLMNVVGGMVMKWKWHGEEYLRKSGVTYTIIRPVGLMGTPGNEKGLQVSQGDILHGIISREDVAEVVVQTLGNTKTLNTTFELSSVDDQPPTTDYNALFTILQPDRIVILY